MQVTVRFFTSLREITDKRDETLTFTDNGHVTISLVLQTLSKKYGKAFTEYIYENNTMRPKGFLQFLLNGASVSSLKGLETELKDGDVLAILPPVGGG